MLQKSIGQIRVTGDSGLDTDIPRALSYAPQALNRARLNRLRGAEAQLFHKNA